MGNGSLRYLGVYVCSLVGKLGIRGVWDREFRGLIPTNLLTGERHVNS